MALTLRGSHAGVFVAQSSGELLFVDSVAAEFLGLNAEETTGTRWLDKIVPSDAERLLDEWQRLLLEGGEITLRVLIAGDSSSKKSLTLRSQPLTLDSTVDQIIVTVSREMGEEPVAHYQQILDAIADMVLVKGEGSRIVWGNKAFRDYYGMTNEELRNIIDAPFNEPDNTQQYIKDDAYVWKSGKVLRIFGEPVIKHDGSRRLFDTVKSPIRDSGGSVRFTVGVSRDITEQRAMEEDLRRAKEAAEAATKAKGDFLANISHELRTPLTLILGPLERMLAVKTLPKELHESLARAHRNATRLLALVNDLLQFSRLEAGESKVTWRRCDPFELVRSIVDDAKPAAQDRGISLVLHGDKAPRQVMLDLYMFDRIVLNLVSNALKFTKPGGLVDVRITCGDNTFEVGVADTGPGIPQDKIPFLFDRFYQVDASSRRPNEGTGLGLALVRNFAELMGGSVKVETELGKGSRFSVVLPISQESTQAAEAEQSSKVPELSHPQLQLLRSISRHTPEQAPEAQQEQPPLVLVVEDNADMRGYIEEILSAKYRVESADEAPLGLQRAHELKPDAIISDVMMPGMNGIEFVGRLKSDRELRQIPVLLLTARSTVEDLVIGLGAGADDYLMKPFSEFELIARVNAALRIRRMYAEHEKLQLEEQARIEAERAREELEQLSKMKDLFLSTLSHELRTPLNAIVGWTQVLLRHEKNENTRRGLQIVARNAVSQAAMIEELLDMSRITSGKIKIEMKELNPAEVLDQAVASILPTSEAKRISIRKVIGVHGCSIRADANRLLQVIWNLLTNAVKFTPEGGAIEVVLFRAGADIVLQVQDTGEGIPAHLIPSIFERFRQADSSTTRRHRGLGLGLSIVKNLVDLQGGTVSAFSAGPQQGSTFTIKFPEVSTMHRTVPPAVVEENAGSQAEATQNRLLGVRALVVEDEEDARALIEQILLDSGAEVHSWPSAAQALQEIKTWSPDVLVSDIGMPGIDGYMLVREMRNLKQTIPAIALTAFAAADDRERAREAGFCSHLAKPVSAEELVSTIADAVGRGVIH